MSLPDDINGDTLPQAWVQYAVLGALTAVIVFWNLGGAVLDEHECYLALAAKAMSEGDANQWLVEGDQRYAIPPRTTLNRWMVPVENGRPRLVKTPLPYWTAAVSMLAGGGASNLTARIPSALCAVLLVWVTLAIGRMMLTPRAAFWGALMLAASVGLQKWGRDARPEMMLCMLIAAAMACFYKGVTAPSRSARENWMAAFWLMMGLANLAKEFVPLLLAWPLVAFVFWRQSDQDRPGDKDGVTSLSLLRFLLIFTLAGLAAHILLTSVPALRWWAPLRIGDEKGAYITMAATLGLPMLGYLIACRGWRPILRLLPTAVPGAVVMLGMFVPWMMYMDHLFPGLAGRVFTSQVADRAAGSGGFEVMSPDKYLTALITLTLPWLVFLPGAFIVPLMKRFSRHRQGLAFLLLWVVGLIVLFAAAAGKRDHYILPAIPPLCLLMGFAAEDLFINHKLFTHKQARWAAGSYGDVAIVGVIGVAGAWWAVSTALRRPASLPRWVMEIILPWMEVPRVFPILLVVAMAAAAVWVVAGIAGWRGRLRPVMPLLASGMAIVLVGFWSFIQLYDPRQAVSEFAAEAARVVPPDAPVYHWGDAQAKTVFYFGRFIPAAQWHYQRQTPPGQQYAGDAELMQWLRENPRAMPWIFGYAEDAGILGPLGYRVRLQREDMQKKSGQPLLTFMLFERDPNWTNR